MSGDSPDPDVFIQGDGICLRALTERDLDDNWYRWFAEPDHPNRARFLRSARAQQRHPGPSTAHRQVCDPLKEATLPCALA